LKQLLLTGGASVLEGLPEILEKYLEMTVRRWNPLENIELSADVSADLVKRQANRMGVALGLALYA